MKQKIQHIEKTKSERQSNFELLKIIAMIMIVSHHFVAKNRFNVDTDIIGVTFNKVFLQFIGNHAFIGNNLFFMCSAYFLVDKAADESRKRLRRIWGMEKQMLFYSLGLWVLFAFLGKTTYTELAKSCFPMSTGIWWYPTVYAVFLMLQPYYQKGLLALEREELKRLIFTMLFMWSVTTVIPFFDYGANNFLCFVMLYAIIFYARKCSPAFLKDKKKCLLLVLTGYLMAACSIIAMDLLGTKFGAASRYACYFIRGNYRLLPMIISVGIFGLNMGWNIQSRFINYIASLTFGVYLIHMYPPMMEFLFSGEGALFDLSQFVFDRRLPLYAIAAVVSCFGGCAIIDAVRKLIFALPGKAAHIFVNSGRE